MIKLSDLKEGDFVVAVYEGQQTPGQVKELNREDKEVCITTDVQDFWFKPEELVYPIYPSKSVTHSISEKVWS